MGSILVTGGAGFIGSNLVNALCRTGEAVRVLDDLSTGRWQNVEEARGCARCELIEADVRNGTEVAEACRGVDIVYHLAAVGSVPASIDRPEHADSVNAGGTVTVLNAARHAGVKRVVYAGSSSAYGDSEILPQSEDMTPHPLSPYAVSKLAGEHYTAVFASVYGLETVSLRYFNIFGPRQRPDGAYAAVISKFGWSAVQGLPLTVYGDGEQTRDFCYVGDAVEANLLAGSSPARLDGQVVNIATGRSVTVNDVSGVIQRIVDRPVDIVHAEERPGDVRHSAADIHRAEELLGYRPTTDLIEGIKQTIAWLRRLSLETSDHPRSD